MLSHHSTGIHKILIPIAATLLLASVIGNLVFARRNVTLNFELDSFTGKLQEVSQTQQQVNLIAQDLVGLSGQFPWMIPLLQKYGLVKVSQPTSAAPTTPPKPK